MCVSVSALNSGLLLLLLILLLYWFIHQFTVVNLYNVRSMDDANRNDAEGPNAKPVTPFLCRLRLDSSLHSFTTCTCTSEELYSGKIRPLVVRLGGWCSGGSSNSGRDDSNNNNNNNNLLLGAIQLTL